MSDRLCDVKFICALMIASNYAQIIFALASKLLQAKWVKASSHPINYVRKNTHFRFA